MLFRVFEYLTQVISGRSDNFDVEGRHYNTSVFVGVLVALLSFIINIHLNFGWVIQWIILGGMSGLIWLYWQSRWKKRFYTWFFIFLALVILSVSWVYNEGPGGSINYLYLMAFVAFMSITPRQQHLKVSITIIINLILLYGFYYFFPQCIVPYSSQATKESDLFFVFIYASLFSALIFSSLRGNYQSEKMKAEAQRAEIEQQHKQITESIIYSRDIQKGLLQNDEDLKKYFDEIFVFWQPKDIIGGDFYSFSRPNKKADRVYCTVSDCTGHGVPGALLTMLGISFTTEIIHSNPEISSDEVLNQLRQRIKSSLSRGRVTTDNRDGMDMSVCIVDKINKTLQYTGANRQVFIVRDKRIIELLPNRFPVGVHHFDEKPFAEQTIPLQTGDIIYMFTDGFADQHGGLENRKFLIAQFKKLLIEVSGLALLEQYDKIVRTFFEWKGLEEQTDDVLVVGFKPL